MTQDAKVGNRVLTKPTAKTLQTRAAWAARSTKGMLSARIRIADAIGPRVAKLPWG